MEVGGGEGESRFHSEAKTRNYPRTFECLRALEKVDSFESKTLSAYAWQRSVVRTSEFESRSDRAMCDFGPSGLNGAIEGRRVARALSTPHPAEVYKLLN